MRSGGALDTYTYPYTYTSQRNTRGGAPGPKVGGTLAGAKKAKDRSSVRGFDNKWERHAKNDAMHPKSKFYRNSRGFQTPVKSHTLGPLGLK